MNKPKAEVINLQSRLEDKEIENRCLTFSEEEGWDESDFNHNYGWYKILNELNKENTGGEQ